MSRHHQHRRNRHRGDRDASGYRRKFHLYRSNDDRVFFGVCGGIAEQYGWSPWAVRFAAIALQCTVFPWLIVAYLFCGLFMKQAPHTPFHSFEEEEIYNSYQTSRSDALHKIRKTYEKLNERLGRLETIVTSPTFKYEDDFKNL